LTATSSTANRGSRPSSQATWYTSDTNTSASTSTMVTSFRIQYASGSEIAAGGQDRGESERRDPRTGDLERRPADREPRHAEMRQDRRAATVGARHNRRAHRGPRVPVTPGASHRPNADDRRIDLVPAEVVIPLTQVGA
jgi:hypothetical protein